MAKCAYCDQKKGKRDCPALGEVCSSCCGEHRRRDIPCPEHCEFLRPTRRDEGGDLSLWLARLTTFVFEDDRTWTAKALEPYLGPDRAIDEYEQGMLAAWLSWGFIDARGERGVDRFLRECHPAPSHSQQRWIDALRGVWFSLFRIVGIRRNVGLELEDLLTGKRFSVTEEAGTIGVTEGTVIVAWIASLPDHHELAGPNSTVPAEAVPLVQRLLASDLPAPAGEDLLREERWRVTARLPELMRCLRVAVRVAATSGTSPEEGAASAAYCEAVYEVRDADAVVTGLAAAPGMVVLEEGRRYRWAPGGPGNAEETVGWVEVRSVRLSLRTLSGERLETGKRLLEASLDDAIEHRFDRLKDALRGLDDLRPARALDVGGPDSKSPLDENEAVVRFDRAVGERIRRSLFEQQHERDLFPGRPRSRRSSSQADGKAAPPRSTEDPSARYRPEGGCHSLPLLGHEALCVRVPGLRMVVRDVCDRLRGKDEEIASVLSPEDLRRDPAVQRFFRMYFSALPMQGLSRDDLVVEQGILGVHLLDLINHELHGRKTFWVDESLAWMLAQTDLDISGSCLRLPFEVFALVFTDPWTLDVAESLLSQEGSTASHAEPLRVLTAYITRLPSEDPEVTSINLSFLFDAAPGKWPYILSRELWVRPDADLAGILDSHAPEITPRNLDPVFLLPEMKKLVHLCVNAVLYSGSARLDPIRLEPASRKRQDSSGAGSDQPSGRPKSGTEDSTSCGEEVFFLPGKIPISHIQRLSDLPRSEGGRKILKRFLVRGHWRRANSDWKDQRIRWIEPYWKGPNLARVIEKEYFLRP